MLLFGIHKGQCLQKVKQDVWPSSEDFLSEGVSVSLVFMICYVSTESKV